MPSRQDTPIDLLKGTLDLIVLRVLDTIGPQHSYGIASRLDQISDKSVALNQGTLVPALVRLEQNGWIKGAWQKTENNRDAKYYSLTKAGRSALTKETERWRRSAGFVEKILCEEP